MPYILELDMKGNYTGTDMLFVSLGVDKLQN